MMSKSERFNRVSLVADTADSYVGTAGLLSLAAFGMFYTCAEKTEERTVVSSSVLDVTAWYGVTRGCLQFIEGLGMLGAEMTKESSRSNGKVVTALAQIIGGLSAVVAGFCYEFAGTSLSYLFLGLGVSAITKLAKSARLFKVWKAEKEDEREYGPAEMVGGLGMSLLEGLSLFTVAFDPLSRDCQAMWSVCNLTAGLLVYPLLNIEKASACRSDIPRYSTKSRGA